MGILDKFDRDEISKPTVTVSFDPEDQERVTNAAYALKTKGCKNRGDFARTAIMEAVKEVEQAMGGADKVKAAADKADPTGERHKRKTRNNGAGAVKNYAEENTGTKPAPAAAKGKGAAQKSA